MCSTIIPGLIKIGKAESDRFEDRMRFLESNGYRNCTGLKRQFAIEVDDYDQAEKDVDEIWFKILDACDSSDYFFIYVNDKAGFFHDDGELPYEIYELVEACHRGDAELFGLRLKSGKFFYQETGSRPMIITVIQEV